MKQTIKEFFNDLVDNIEKIKINGIKKQIPNILTFSRALAPLIIIPTLLFNKLYIAIIELIIFAITDFFDGKLARKYNCVSQFGIKLDAICDKVFAFGLIIPAIFKYQILFINMMLEICISYIIILSESKNNHPKSNMVGKIKTALLSITIILTYIPSIDKIFVYSISIITVIFQVIAFAKYRKIDIVKDKMKK